MPGVWASPRTFGPGCPKPQAEKEGENSPEAPGLHGARDGEWGGRVRICAPFAARKGDLEGGSKRTFGWRELSARHGLRIRSPHALPSPRKRKTQAQALFGVRW